MGRIGLWGNNGMGAPAPPSPSEGPSTTTPSTTTTETSGRPRELRTNGNNAMNDALATAGTVETFSDEPIHNHNNTNNNNNGSNDTSEAETLTTTATTGMNPAQRLDCMKEENTKNEALERKSDPDDGVLLLPAPQLRRNDGLQRQQQQPQHPGAYSHTGSSLERAPRLRYSLVGSSLTSNQDALPSPGRELEEEDTIPEQSLVRSNSNASVGSENKILEDIPSSHLVVATMVEEENHQRPSLLPVARRRSGADLVQQKEVNANKKKILVYAGAGLLLLVASVGALAMAFLLSNDTKNRDDSTTSEPLSFSPSPTMSPGTASRPLPPMENLDLLYNDLPEITKKSLYNHDSPQYEAWQWLFNHPNITAYPEWRKKQLFAMATFFYSFEGPNWPDRKRWMDVNVNECSWTLTDEEVLYWAHQSDTIFGPNSYSPADIQPCNENGELHNLGLSNIFLPTNAEPTIPPEIALLSSIKTLAIVYSQISVKLSDLLIPELIQLTNLENLNLQSSGVSGTIPKILGQLTGLRHLTLGENQLTASIPIEITRMTSLEYFNINSVGGVTGTIPTDLGLLTRLTGLILFETSVGGPIPSELGMLSNIREMGFSGSKLTGSIPSELGLWTSVEEVWMRDNALTGTLPSELGLMTNCIELVLGNHQDLELQGSSNEIFGSLPKELWQLSKLEALDLANLPNLFGNLPTDAMSKLTMLRLEGSPHLFGTIPNEICYLQKERAPELIGAALDFDCSDGLCGCNNCECADEEDNETKPDSLQGNHSPP